jgi:hypothetical protein
LAALAGCAEVDYGPPFPPDLGPPLLELVYQGTSNERPLERAMLHSRINNYHSSENLLTRPLGVGERVDIVGFAPDSYYLTVVRKKLSLPVSNMIALTTGQPLELISGRCEVWVFDESFRIHDPKPNNQDAGVMPPRDARVDGMVIPDLIPDPDAAASPDATSGQ